MSATRISRRRLRSELARRAWSARDLARASGVSTATLSSVMQGRGVSARTLGKIALALTRAPIVPGLEGLLAEDDQEGAE